MSNDYYKNLLIEKLKKDIISELSERCNNNQELVTIVNEYFDENSINFEYHKSSEIYRDREKY